MPAATRHSDEELGDTFGQKGWPQKTWKMPAIKYLAAVISSLPTNPKTGEDLGKVRAICYLLREEGHYAQRAHHLLTPLQELVKQVPLLPRTTATPLDEHQLIAEELHSTLQALGGTRP